MSERTPLIPHRESRSNRPWWAHVSYFFSLAPWRQPPARGAARMVMSNNALLQRIFRNLDFRSLSLCRQVHSSWLQRSSDDWLWTAMLRHDYPSFLATHRTTGLQRVLSGAAADAPVVPGARQAYRAAAEKLWRPQPSFFDDFLAELSTTHLYWTVYVLGVLFVVIAELALVAVWMYTRFPFFVAGCAVLVVATFTLWYHLSRSTTDQLARHGIIPFALIVTTLISSCVGGNTLSHLERIDGYKTFPATDPGVKTDGHGIFLFILGTRVDADRMGFSANRLQWGLFYDQYEYHCVAPIVFGHPSSNGTEVNFWLVDSHEHRKGKFTELDEHARAKCIEETFTPHYTSGENLWHGFPKLHQHDTKYREAVDSAVGNYSWVDADDSLLIEGWKDYHDRTSHLLAYAAMLLILLPLGWPLVALMLFGHVARLAPDSY